MTTELKQSQQLLNAAARAARSARASQFEVIASFFVNNEIQLKGFHSREDAERFFSTDPNVTDFVIVERRNENMIWMT